MPSGPTSIKDRVRSVILLTSLIVLLATAAAFVIYELISFKSQSIRSLSTLGAVVADTSTASLVFDQEENAEVVLAALRAEPDIVAAALYDARGGLFATYPSTLKRTAYPPLRETGVHRFSSGALELYTPVMHQGKVIGTLYLRSSLQGFYQRFWRYGGIVAAVLTVSILAAFVLSTLLQRRISDPILALTRAAQEVAEREDYSIRAVKLTDDELGTLTDAFNRMLIETQEHQGRLAEQARLLDLSSDAIIVRDEQGRIKYWNNGAEELYGWTRAEALEKVKSELLKTEYPEPLEEIQAKLLRDSRWAGDLLQTRRDGTKITVSTRWVLDRDAAGNAGRVLITDTDITVRKQAEELMKSEAKRLDSLVDQRTARLQETIGELESFSYSISHDMRAPLRAMQGYARALLTDYQQKLDAQGQHYLERIARASNRMDALIQDVLAYSRVSKEQVALHPVDLEALIDDILPSHPEFNPPLASIIIERPLLRIVGHEAYLTQCITNLLGNAVKFVAEGVAPEVHIRTEKLAGKVRLWFEDNGIGIEPGHQERIFQIFGQVYGEKKYGGTGIGLAIVRKAAQRMNGDAGVLSALGKGSRFWIELHDASKG